MITAIREIRKAKKLTLQEVAERCAPPTTAQTIGRLETGMRTVSVAWLNRIADALGVEASDLVRLPEQGDLPVAAILSAEGAQAPRHETRLAPPRPTPGMVAVQAATGIGDYRPGDEIWCERLEPDAYASALNRDVLLPRPAGRYLFGRLIGREGDRLQVLPLEAGGKQQVVSDPPWIGMAVKVVRGL
ncbi:helix-turn-helix domain-containing protein [Parasphingopyxis marina]|uniref:Helix-turn-helix transcriptional regulator n=1 Tax=Parasphingopyxis marina TaxID=2761622 RepID=A0A842I266_9SPHN|nr:helix-turn-helix transcriptional regulator [Parasphingopyxis marina]MBC2778350.1 helix-turn-helix transcriptional regulator [Parasphingopyxis marina]